VYKIKLLNKISSLGLAVLPKENYTCAEDIADPQGIIVRSASMHEMEFGDELLAIARAGAGVNNIPAEKCTEQGICVFNTPGANANAVKELAVLGLLMSARKVFAAMQWAQGLKGEGDKVPALVEKGKSNFTGPELSGKKLGLIGLGKIGMMLANAAVALEMEVYGYDPYLTPEAASKLECGVHRVDTMGEIYSQCDFISLHLPSTRETKGMINAQLIATMKPGMRILNFARGDLVNSADIIAALDAGQLTSYLTDFPDETLLGHEGVLAIPHLGASTPESEENCAVMAADQMREYLENGNVVNSINLPGLVVPPSSKPRVAVIYKGAPGAADQIAKLVPGSLNKAERGEIAYAIVELDASPAADLVEKIKAIPGVLRVRQI